MKIALCLFLSYLLGTLNPAALIARLMHKDLRDSGTKNLGATNVGMHFGKRLAIPVMLFDLFKAFFAVVIAEILVPSIAWMPLLAGALAVVGHIFPFYLGFRGGKGLAAFGGMVLGLSPWLFLLLLLVCGTVMLVCNYSLGLVISAAILFPFLITLKSGGNLTVLLIACLISALLVFRFRENFTKIREGREFRVRDYIKQKLMK